MFRSPRGHAGADSGTGHLKPASAKAIAAFIG